MTRSSKILGVSLLVGLALGACGKQEEILQGERLDIRSPNTEAGAKPPAEPAAVKPTKLSLSAPVVNNSWTHRNGTAEHTIRHPALNRNLTRIWSAKIGQGSSRKAYLSADPVVAGNKIFTLDSAGSVKAFSLAGEQIWSVDLTPPHEKSKEASGGGLAYGSETLMVTTGHGEVISMNPANGEIRWKHKASGAVSSAPTITGNTVIAISRDNVALGLNIANGRIRWRQTSAGSTAGVFGAGSAAVTGDLAIVPFASGEVSGTLARNGIKAWSGAVSGGRKGTARSFVGDISSDPVAVGDTIYLANQSGRMVALERRDGSRKWTVNEGSYSPVWVAGGAVFVITDDFAVKRLNASDGGEVWSTSLPDYKSDRPRRQKDAYAYFGPTLAGGQIWVAGSDGLMRSFNPENGVLTGTVEIPGGAASQPAIAGGRMYILSANGQLHAFQ